MKKGIHPNYRFVVFRDVATGEEFLVRSTVETKETTIWKDGKEYPLYKLEVSAYSHPFFTGRIRYVDTTGRIEKFKQKYAKYQKKGK
ncbi:MAG: type B 50S ribosomal protein L31 [Chlorobi bacterium]|nr:type B 50S ribosomal protein L31 [Chlorobiota bacterium]